MTDLFKSLNLKTELLKNLEELKFTSMTPIQAMALPLVLNGQDVIAQAKTGSGKTAAFGLGILNDLNPTDMNIQALILCPTRELAEQVAAEIRRLARMISNVKVLSLCGGVAEFHQETSLAHGAHIVVGTPGRVLRLLQKRSLALRSVKTLVLDEADRMLDMGFINDILDIVSNLPKKRQSLLFSATFPKEIKNLSKDVLTNPYEVKVDTEHEKNNIAQHFYEVSSHKDKDAALLKILANYRPARMIVFCKTKQITDSLTNFLQDNSIEAAGIHGDLEQNERTLILTQFANRSLSVLVATDVAARGLDIEDLEAVVNFDLPSDAEVYVHRIGRTGRAGNQGLAFSLLIQKEFYKLDAIEKYLSSEIKIEKFEGLEANSDYDLIPPMKTLFISGGKKDKLRPGDILGAMVGEAKLEPSDVGAITILNIISYVAIQREKAADAVKKLNSGKIKNRKFRVGLA